VKTTSEKRTRTERNARSSHGDPHRAVPRSVRAEPAWQTAGRLALDVAGSSLVLALTAPLMLIISILIKLDSPGPVLFRHVRIGEDRRTGDRRRIDHRSATTGADTRTGQRTRSERRSGGDRRTQDLFGRPFVLYKFRTMYFDAKARFPHLYTYDYTHEQLTSLPIKVLVGLRQARKESNGCGGAGDGTSDDPRVTRFGRWLRRTSLDELPNFINVLRGDMHLVGPRPDMHENIRYYPPAHREKLRVKPGVTGLAQIRGRGNLSFFETNELDLQYVKQRSFGNDIRIILKTIRVTLSGDGAF